MNEDFFLNVEDCIDVFLDKSILQFLKISQLVKVGKHQVKSKYLQWLGCLQPKIYNYIFQKCPTNYYCILTLIERESLTEIHAHCQDKYPKNSHQPANSLRRYLINHIICTNKRQRGNPVKKVGIKDLKVSICHLLFHNKR